jgi:hypothetical protein
MSDGAGPTEPAREPEPDRDGTSLAIGIAVRLALGLVTDNVGMWLPIGVALGVTGVFAGRRRSG